MQQPILHKYKIFEYFIVFVAYISKVVQISNINVKNYY